MRILIIEDDNELCTILSEKLNLRGYSCDICNNGDDAFFYVLKQVYDLIILDRMLPEKDGLTILNEIRNKNIKTPVIMLTAMNTLQNKIEGLDSGADDYLVKPFSIDELFARIRALIRRPPKINSENIISISDITLNINESVLHSHYASCNLSKRESELLEFLMKNINVVLTREMLISNIWGSSSSITESNLENFVSFLRKRLRIVKSRASLKTVRGIGYRLEE